MFQRFLALLKLTPLFLIFCHANYRSFLGYRDVVLMPKTMMILSCQTPPEYPTKHLSQANSVHFDDDGPFIDVKNSVRMTLQL